MDDADPRIALLQPPLNEASIKARRNLLASSFVGIVIIKTGLIPTQVATLGIQFAPTDQRMFLIALVALTIYFAIAFVIYASTDLARWGLLVGRALEMRSKEGRLRVLRKELGLMNTDLVNEFDGVPDHRKEDVRQLAIALAGDIEERLEKRTKIFGVMVLPSAILRAALDFVFPLLFAIYALWLLYKGFSAYGF